MKVNGYRIVRVATLLLLFGCASVVAISFAAQGISTSAATINPYQIVSVDSSNSGQGNGNSTNPMVSANGRYVFFESAASNLVNNDTNGKTDIFRRDLKTNITSRVSTSSNNVEPNSNSSLSGISENGRYFTYKTAATNLEAGNVPYAYTYIHDVVSGLNQPVTHSGWNQSQISLSSVSNDGRFLLGTAVPPLTDANGANINSKRAFVYDRLSGSWTRLATPISGGAEQNAAQSELVASCDGAFGAFTSTSTNLTASDTNGSLADLFIVDLRTGFKVTNITESFNAGVSSPRMSCNGNYLTFTSSATNIVSAPIPGSNAGTTHLYRYDRLSGEFSLVNQSSTGDVCAYPSVWGVADSGKVVFMCKTSTDPYALTEVRIRDEDNNTTELVNGSNMPFQLAMDKNATMFVFASTATNLVSGDTNGKSDIFVSEIN